MQFSLRCNGEIWELTYYQKEITIFAIHWEINGKIWRSPIDGNGNEPQKSAILAVADGESWSVYAGKYPCIYITWKGAVMAPLASIYIGFHATAIYFRRTEDCHHVTSSDQCIECSRLAGDGVLVK